MLTFRPLARQVPLLSRHTGRISISAPVASITIRRFSYQQPPIPSFASTLGTTSPFTRRLFYRKDGSPRSKKRGVFIAISAATAVVLLSAIEKLFIILEFQGLVAWSLVHCFRIDQASYASQDFSDYKSTVEYFRDLVLVLLVNYHEINQETVHRAFEIMTQWEGKHREKVHGVFRAAAEEIHTLLAGGQDIAQMDLVEFGVKAFKILSYALKEVFDGSVPQVKITLKSSPVDKMKDYEVIG
ncbi:uncharacterized protein BT62DRAFT_328305 [Guyanagaster necrorhizus]|uniref:Uncharacterized protein n=1 Tax=Guyanagaster necrorhizus TaxID=856835 RepID=A0A9P7VNZ4_9AGAR|nr:uncharacterized protein BT62DRAFT_328305 [Guyanagaster necrorhizus MCA 3950]KAG7443381.1 hypothetical protein BT62DRAFT_328305 [Guyanagaster necrorhizus MCA 3950]